MMFGVNKTHPQTTHGIIHNVIPWLYWKRKKSPKTICHFSMRASHNVAQSVINKRRHVYNRGRSLMCNWNLHKQHVLHDARPIRVYPMHNQPTPHQPTDISIFLFSILFNCKSCRLRALHNDRCSSRYPCCGSMWVRNPTAATFCVCVSCECMAFPRFLHLNFTFQLKKRETKKNGISSRDMRYAWMLIRASISISIAIPSNDRIRVCTRNLCEFCVAFWRLRQNDKNDDCDLCDDDEGGDDFWAKRNALVTLTRSNLTDEKYFHEIPQKNKTNKRHFELRVLTHSISMWQKRGTCVQRATEHTNTIAVK